LTGISLIIYAKEKELDIISEIKEKINFSRNIDDLVA
jgi:hypothetical protein